MSISEKEVNDCVRFILYRDASKIPITKKSIESLFKKKQITEIIEAAKAVLSDIYGYDLITTKSKTAYILVLNNNRNNNKNKLPAHIDPRNRKILFAVLAHTYMNQTPVKTDDMGTFLNQAGLIRDGENVMDYLQDFTKQEYLDHDKVNSTLKWGERANKEVPPMFLLEKVAQALDKPPEYFKVQYNQAKSNKN